MKDASMLSAQFSSLLSPSLFISHAEYRQFAALIKTGKLTKIENPINHCCVMFLPYNPQTNEIFIVHHKKARQWLVPGGHMEKNELLEDTLNREVQEEIGITLTEKYTPFMYSVIQVNNPGYACRAHYDSWFVLPVTDIHPDLSEFNEVKWVLVDDAKNYITHPTYREAIKRLLK